jgi:hypothetical protein
MRKPREVSHPQTIAADISSTLVRGLIVIVFSAATAVACSHLLTIFMR